MADSVRLGEEVGYSLSIKYPNYMDLVFADSNFNFYPFEYNRKQYFTTSSDSIISMDSIIYYLATYEIDKVQSLRVPVYLLKLGDSSTIFPTADSIRLKEVIAQLPDSVKQNSSIGAKSNTDLVALHKQFNYPYWLLGLVTLVIVILVVIIFFGKKIKRKLQLYRLQKKHQKFIARFNNLVVKLRNNEAEPEVVLVTWKQYMERLDKMPYTKLTTTEILEHMETQDIKKPLKAVDRSIYGNLSDQDLYRSFEDLEYFSEHRYNVKVEQLKYG